MTSDVRNADRMMADEADIVPDTTLSIGERLHHDGDFVWGESLVNDCFQLCFFRTLTGAGASVDYYC